MPPLVIAILKLRFGNRHFCFVLVNPPETGVFVPSFGIKRTSCDSKSLNPNPPALYNLEKPRPTIVKNLPDSKSHFLWLDLRLFLSFNALTQSPKYSGSKRTQLRCFTCRYVIFWFFFDKKNKSKNRFFNKMKCCNNNGMSISKSYFVRVIINW